MPKVKISDTARRQAIRLLERALDLLLEGEEFPVIVAARELKIPYGSPAWELAHAVRMMLTRGKISKQNDVTLTAAIKRLRKGWSPS